PVGRVRPYDIRPQLDVRGPRVGYAAVRRHAHRVERLDHFLSLPVVVVDGRHDADAAIVEAVADRGDLGALALVERSRRPVGHAGRGDAGDEQRRGGATRSSERCGTHSRCSVRLRPRNNANRSRIATSLSTYLLHPKKGDHVGRTPSGSASQPKTTLSSSRKDVTVSRPSAATKRQRQSVVGPGVTYGTMP